MRERDLRVPLVAALRPVPDFSRLSLLRHSNASQIRKLLRWLDESGLALYLLTQLKDHEVLGQVPKDFSAALESRLAANQVRTAAMLSEFARLVDTFRGNGVQFCGYDQGEIAESGEVTFTTPLRHIPTANDDIYATPRHREVDLLTTLRLFAHGVSIPTPTPDFNDLKTKILLDIAFPTLPSEEMFCLQVMHAFRHLLGSWIRVSWLYEIGYFIDRHYGDEDLWRAIADRMGHDSRTRNAFGLVLSLARALFPRPIPKPLAGWCLQSLPPRIETWVAHFGLKTAIADLDGAKFTLFVHREFVDDRAFWTSYVKYRIFPIGRRSSIGRVAITDTGTRIKAKVSQWRHTMSRSIFHARSLFSLPVEAIRFRYALRSVERQRVLVAEALTR